MLAQCQGPRRALGARGVGAVPLGTPAPTEEHCALLVGVVGPQQRLALAEAGAGAFPWASHPAASVLRGSPAAALLARTPGLS